MKVNAYKNFYKNKKVFITGHTGFKGAWLSKMLLNFECDVIGYSLEPNNLSMFNILKLKDKMKSYIGDIRNLEHLKKTLLVEKPDIIIHMAAQSLVKKSYSNPVETYTVNVMGTVNILEALRYSKTVKSFVNVTTDKVYKNREWSWGYRENEELCGLDPYSNSKSCSELVHYTYKNCFFNNNNSIALSTARSGNVIGGGDFSENRILPDCIRAATLGKNVAVRNPCSIRPYQHVLDCLNGYLLLAMLQYKDKIKYENTYNFGPNYNDNFTTSNIVDIFCKYWGNNLTWEKNIDNIVHEAEFLKLDSSKAANILNWKPVWDIEIAIYKTVEWYKTHINKGDINELTDIQINQFYKGVSN